MTGSGFKAVCGVALLAALLSGCHRDKTSSPPTPPVVNYTVGGSVSGLQGSLTLANGAESRVVTADGSFSFAVPSTAGTSYNVTIVAQPANQTCTLAGASGTVTANVTGIAVSCATNRVSVGGTLNSLPGVNLVLQLNGADDLAPVAPGAFQFSQSVTSGSAYAVTVRTQPASPALPCTVSNGTGTAGNAAITNLIVDCPAVPVFTQQASPQSVSEATPATFTVAVSGMPMPTLQWQISTDAGNTWNNLPGANQPGYTTPPALPGHNGQRFRVLAINSAGSATSVPVPLTVNPAPDAGPWSGAVRISTHDGTSTGIFGHRVVMNANGDGIAVWGYTTSLRETEIYANRYLAGSGWQGARLLSRDASLNIENGFPVVAINSSGAAIVAWTVVDTLAPVVASSLVARYYTPGQDWGATQPVEAATESVFAPQVTLFDSGMAHAIWIQRLDSGGLRDTALMSSTTNGGDWSAAQVISPTNASMASLAGNVSGQATVAWLQYDGSQNDVKAARWTGAGWSATADIDRNTVDDAVATAVGTSANGESVVAWVGSPSGLLSTARHDSQTWGAAVPQNAGTDVSAASIVDIAMTDDGDALVHWASEGSTGYFLTRLNGDTWSTGDPLFTPLTGLGLRIAMNGAGEQLIVWSHLLEPPPLRATNNLTADIRDFSTVSFQGYDPQIALGGNGNGLVIFRAPGPSGTELWASEYQ